MHIGSIVFGIMLVSLYAFLWIGLPMLAVRSRRKRREDAIRRQIALTDVIQERFGAVASPWVEKPLRGPWRVRIGVPFSRPDITAGILAAACGVFSDGETYQVILTPRPDPDSGGTRLRAERAAAHRPGRALAA